MVVLVEKACLIPSSVGLAGERGPTGAGEAPELWLPELVAPLFELPLEYFDALIDTAHSLIEQHRLDSANFLTNYLIGQSR